MDNYIVSARKYRPKTFDAVIGQHALTTTLKNAVASGKLAHAYLFCGPRGVGKTTCARIFAKTINCLHPKANGEACEQCESCVAFNEGRNYNIFELDAASNNSVEDIRQLISQVHVPPQVGRYKVYIIDEVHMLSPAAFNAFLKTLEEPPAHVIFILATTEKHKILPTILSRCQIFDFNRMEVPDIVSHLKHVADSEGIKYEEEALGVIARKADGGMRDAMSIFDQVTGFTQGNITYKQVIEDLNVLDYDYFFTVTDALLKHDIPTVLLSLNEILARGFQGSHFISGLAEHFRDLLVSRDEQTLPLLEVSSNVLGRYKEQAKRCPSQFLYRALRLCNSCDIDYRTSSNKRLLVELTLIEIAQTTISDDDETCGPGPKKQLHPIFLKSTETKNGTSVPLTDKAATNSVVTPKKEHNVDASTIPHTSQIHHAPQKTSLDAKATPGKPQIKTISIKLDQHATNDSSQTTPMAASNPSEQSQAEAFDQNALLYQWNRYAATLPKDLTALAGRMKNITPVLRPNWTVDVQLENELVLQNMELVRDKLTQFLRHELHNSHITLHFSIIKSEQRKAYTRNEVLVNMIKKNEALGHLVKDLKLELA